MVFLLLFAALEILVAVGYQNEIHHVAENGVMLILAAHGNQAVLKSAGVFAHHQQRAVLKAMGASRTGNLHLRQHAGEDAVSPRHLAAHFNGLFDGAEDHVVAGMNDFEIRRGDVLVFVDHLQQLFFVDRQHALAVSGVVAEDDVGHMEGSDFKFHSWNHSF